jgi:hypothetical protein
MSAVISGKQQRPIKIYGQLVIGKISLNKP